MNNKIAILLATYNGEQWLDEQVQSIRFQSHQDWRLFVCDDKSRDNSLAVVERHAAEDERITVLTNTVRSGSAASNFMATLLRIDLGAFDFLAFCDQDDIWAPRRLTRALEQLAAHEADGYSCDLVAFDNSRRSSRYIGKNAQQRPFDYLFQGASAGCTYVLTRKAATLVAEKLRAHPQGMAVDKSHDWLIYAICRSAGLRWRHDASAQVFYRQHASNVYGANIRWAGLHKRWEMARAGWYRGQVLWNARFLASPDDEAQILMRVQRFGFRDRCWLALRARQFRRDHKEALFLGALLLFGLM